MDILYRGHNSKMFEGLGWTYIDYRGHHSTEFEGLGWAYLEDTTAGSFNL